MLRKLSGWMMMVFPSLVFAYSPPYNANELAIVKQYLLDNIATKEHPFIKHENGRDVYSKAGAVLASPSYIRDGVSQDYAFHWTRDAAITMNTIVDQYVFAAPAEKTRLKPYLYNYIEFERNAQSQQSRSGEETLGQPKYNIDGTIYEGPWGRPQNDGAALRAIVLSRIAQLFIEEGQGGWVREHLLDMIERDLDYVVSHWRQASFGLWEEVYDADHFFTKMVQRKSLVEGAYVFSALHETLHAQQYQEVASELLFSLEKHWDAARGYISETITQQDYKGGGLNSSIILGVLYGDLSNANDPYAVTNEKVMSTVYYIRNAFSSLYKINIEHPLSPPLIGRYPNDIYDGANLRYGNPWPLLTNEMAQYYYRCASKLEQAGVIHVTPVNRLFFQQIKTDLVVAIGDIAKAHEPDKFKVIIDALRREGDAILQNVKSYATCDDDHTCLHFAEQIDRASGESVSARDLTWGYASILNANNALSAHAG